MKAVLYLDMPKTCNGCPLFDHGPRDIGCRVSANHMMDSYRKPNWCPLQQAPGYMYHSANWVIGQAQHTDEDVDFWRGYQKGWNDYRHEITGEDI